MGVLRQFSRYSCTSASSSPCLETDLRPILERLFLLGLDRNERPSPDDEHSERHLTVAFSVEAQDARHPRQREVQREGPRKRLRGIFLEDVYQQPGGVIAFGGRKVRLDSIALTEGFLERQQPRFARLVQNYGRHQKSLGRLGRGSH